MKQQGLKLCFASAPWGRVVVMAGGVTRKEAGVESVVKTALFREDSFRQSVAHKGSVKAGKDVNFKRSFYPASR